MSKKVFYKCKCKYCGKQSALLEEIRITSIGKFRCTFRCIDNTSYNITVNGKDWKKLNYKGIQKLNIEVKMNKIIHALCNEVEDCRGYR